MKGPTPRREVFRVRSYRYASEGGSRVAISPPSPWPPTAKSWITYGVLTGGPRPFIGVTYSTLVTTADSYLWNKKTYNNAISALRRAFAFGYLDYPDRRDPAAALKCARLRKKDRPPIDPFSIQNAETFIAALHQDWGDAYGNYDEFRFFTGLRPSEEVALLVSDYDAAHGVLSISKARVQGIDKNMTKTGEDRRIVLCPRAVAILEWQLQLRESAMRAGLVKHEHLFFTDTGAPIRSLGYDYWSWQCTLKRLAIRYRKPFMARHTSVSWNLMIGRNPLLVAKEHGHRLTTMLSVYAAWTEGAAESDILAIREAITCTSRPVPDPPPDGLQSKECAECATVVLAGRRHHARRLRSSSSQWASCQLG